MNRMISSAGDRSWRVGRAGMLYRDLIPNRWGGRLIASHIEIRDGGPVPDYVHFHRVRFQMIYAYQGWVKVVYEDQGPPFTLQAGDCVLQPPGIRHRVLESSPRAQVIELTSPADHETVADESTILPTPGERPNRTFGGQRFVRHVASQATWQPWYLDPFEARTLGLAWATGGMAEGWVARPRHPVTSTAVTTAQQRPELLVRVVLGGALTVRGQGEDEQRLVAGDALVVPPGLAHQLGGFTPDLEFLDVVFAWPSA